MRHLKIVNSFLAGCFSMLILFAAVEYRRGGLTYACTVHKTFDGVPICIEIEVKR